MIKNKLIILSVSALALASCDAHRDFADTSIKVGHVLCTDGSVLSYDDYRNSIKEAIAVVFYTNSDDEVEGNGYAVYLHDCDEAAFADSLVSQGTSADLTALDGNSNTFALFSATDANSPMAQQVFDIWQFGQSAYVPSVAQMRLLYLAKDEINPIIWECGGEPILGEAEDMWYWTSTEVSGQQSAKAWLYSLGSGAIQETPKSQAHKVRPIITLNN
jgi:hypothetical protein